MQLQQRWGAQQQMARKAIERAAAAAAAAAAMHACMYDRLGCSLH